MTDKLLSLTLTRKVVTSTARARMTVIVLGANMQTYDVVLDYQNTRAKESLYLLAASQRLVGRIFDSIQGDSKY